MLNGIRFIRAALRFFQHVDRRWTILGFAQAAKEVDAMIYGVDRSTHRIICFAANAILIWVSQATKTGIIDLLTNIGALRPVTDASLYLSTVCPCPPIEGLVMTTAGLFAGTTPRLFSLA